MLNAALMSAEQPPLEKRCEVVRAYEPARPAQAGYIRDMEHRCGTTRQPLETSRGNQPQGQDLLHFACPTAITQTNWSKGIPYFRERPRSISDDAFV